MVELPRGDETPRVTTEGEGVLGENGRGQGGDETPLTTQATKAQGASGSANERMVGPRMAAPPCPQQGMAEEIGSAGTPTSHTAGTDGSRPEHGALARHKYDLLAITGMSVDPSDTGNPWSEDRHEATIGTAGQARRETKEGDKTQQCALPACGI